jgi:hypothetical protein
MATPDARFNITASDRTAAAFTSVRSGLQRVNAGIFSLRTAIVSATAGFVSFRTIMQSVDAYKKQEQAIAALNASIASMGRQSKGLSVELQRLASQIQREGVIGDEAILEGQSFLTTYGKITDDLLPRTSRVMADLAAKFGGDAVRAANTLGKASEGMVGELTRVGISLSENAKQSKDFNLILSEIESQVTGLNRALGQTATGSMQQFKNALGDVQEVGGEVTAIAIAPFLKDATNRMLGFTDSVEQNRAIVEGWARESFAGLLKVAEGVNELRGRFEQIRLLWPTMKASYLEFFQIPVESGLHRLRDQIKGSFLDPGGAAADFAGQMGEPLGELHKMIERPTEALADFQNEIIGAGDVMQRSRAEFNAWAATVSKSFDVALQRARELREGVSGGRIAERAPSQGATDEKSRDKLEAEMEKRQERLQAALDMLRESGRTENEIIEANWVEQQTLIADLFDEGLISRGEQNALLEELELQHQAKMGDIQAQGLLKARVFEQMNYQQRTKFIFGQLAQLTAGVAQHSRAMFTINKIAGIANAIINTAQGVTEALKIPPPPLGWAMAAVTAGVGIAQIQAIKGTEFGGGGTGIAPSIAGTTPAPPVSNVGTAGVGGSLQQLPPQPPQPNITVNFNSTVPPRGDQLDELMDEIQERIADGAKAFA